MPSPTTLSMDLLRENGYLPAIVERRVGPYAVDLFGIIDIVALRGSETLAIQATGLTNVSGRVAKLTDSENISVVRKAGWRIEVWGWGNKCSVCGQKTYWSDAHRARCGGGPRLRQVDLS